MQKNYNDFNTYLKNTFGCKVYKVIIDAGFSCPNRDGTLSYGGCIYCNEKGSGMGHSHLPIKDQVLHGIKFIKKWYNAEKIMVYFQAFSNTYASAEKLEKIYNQALCHDDIVAIAIGTRPDCIDEEKLKIINKLTEKYEVWLEYGLQSCHNKTLKLINRHHTFEQFMHAIKLTKKHPKIKICTHIILGLPEETKKEMLETVNAAITAQVNAVKFHPLYIEKGTTIEKIYKQKPFKILSKEEYVDIITSAIKKLPPEIIIQRLTGDCKKQNLVAPEWMLDKQGVLNEINTKLTSDL